MIARIFKHGSGSGARAIGYLQSERNHTGELRENPPELLRGDPEGTAELIDSLSFSQRYTSGVLSFTQDEAARLEKNPAVRFELIDSFEQDFLAPGMDISQLAIVWTQHREKERTEIHFTIANVDLDSGKRFAAYYDRADRTRLAAWQDFQNLSRDLDNPRDPQRARAFIHDTKLPKDCKGLAAVLKELIAQKCNHGELRDRAEIVGFIESRGVSVGRQGKDYITVIHGEGKNERFRLKGALFHEDYRFDRTIEARNERDGGENQADRERSIEHVRNRLETAMQYRREYLEKRFGRRRERVSELAQGAEQGRESMGAVAPESRQMGDYCAGGSDIGAVPGGDRCLAPLVEDREPGAGSHDAVHCGQRAEDDASGRTDLGLLPRTDDHGQRQEDRDSRTLQEGGINEYPDERTGRPAYEFLAAIEQRISAARRAFDRTIQELRGVIQDAIERAQTGAKRTLEAFGRTDSALRGHSEYHAAALETVGRFGQQARRAMNQIDRELEDFEHDHDFGYE